MYDFIVIGNGILGSSLAYQLKKLDPTVKVAMIGPSNREGSATKTAGAMTNVFAELENGQLENPALAERFQLTLKGSQMWDDYAAELSEYAEKPIQHKKGTYVLLNAQSTPLEVKNFRYVKSAITRCGSSYENLNPADIPWLKAAADACPIEVIKVSDGRIDTRSVLSALDCAMQKNNIDVYSTTVTSVQDAKNGLFSKTSHKVILESKETLETKNIVFANGAYAQSLIDPIEKLRCEIPRLLFGAGSSIDLSFPDWVHQYGGLDPAIFELDGVVRTLDRGGSCGLHLIPMGNREFYLGASSGVWMDPEPLPRIHGIKSLLQGIVKDFSYAFFFAGMDIRNAGFRPTTIDCFPLIGESHMEGIWFLNGTKRDGFTMSPYLTENLAKAMLGQPHELPERFRPARKLISYKTKDEAIEATRLMMLGSDRQHGGMQAPYMVGSYQQTRLDWVHSVYKKRRISDFGVHPEVIHLYDNNDFYRVISHPMEKVGKVKTKKTLAPSLELAEAVT